MPALKNIFLSALLLTVACRVKGNSTTVTLFDVEGVHGVTASPIDVSAIDVESNGGTLYVENAEFTITSGGSPVTTTAPFLTFVEAASWMYISIQGATTGPLAGGSFNDNCTLGASGDTAECVEKIDGAQAAGTVTQTAPVVPLATVTITGPTPTSSSAATTVDNPIFNRLPSLFGGILFILMFF